MQLSEEEYFAQHWPEIAELAGAARKRAIAELRQTNPQVFAEFQKEKRRFEASNEFARASGRFDLTARGKVNTYSLFAELFSSAVSEKGRAGVIVPTGIATDASTAPFFASLVENKRLARLIDFENRDAIFPSVHRSYKFSLLTVGHGIAEATFAFFLSDTAQLAQSERIFTLSPEQIARINPNTKTAPVFRSKFDAELTAKIYDRVPVLINETLGEEGNPWQIEFRQGLFNMTSDSGLFRTAGQLEEMGAERKGTEWVLRYPEPQPPERYVPLYEAKMIHQFDHRWATYDGVESQDAKLAEKQNPDWEVTPRYWVPQAEVRSRLSQKNWSHNWLMGWRDIARATDERTVICSVIPSYGVGHTSPLIMSPMSTHKLAALLANLDSITVDYVARTKIGGTHLTYGYLNQFPILPPSAYTQTDLDFIVPRVLELTCTSYSMAGFVRDLGLDGAPFAWDVQRRAHLRAELDAWYAHAYCLTRDELRYILDPADVMGADYPSETFRVLKNNEEKLHNGEYRTRILVLGAWDKMERGELPCPQPYVTTPRHIAYPVASAQQNVLSHNPFLGSGPLFEGIEATSVAIPMYVELSTFPDGAWKMPSYNTISVQLQLAAILKQLSGPTSAARVRLAVLYALHPNYLTPRLSGAELNDWQRLVGDSARTSGAANVIQFIPRINTEWRDAYTQLRGMHALIEDAANGTWAPGSVVQDFLTEGWPDGRAGFVLKAMEGMEIESSIAELPADVQAWVKVHAA